MLKRTYDPDTQNNIQLKIDNKHQNDVSYNRVIAKSPMVTATHKVNDSWERELQKNKRTHAHTNDTDCSICSHSQMNRLMVVDKSWTEREMKILISIGCFYSFFLAPVSKGYWYLCSIYLTEEKRSKKKKKNPPIDQYLMKMHNNYAYWYLIQNL